MLLVAEAPAVAAPPEDQPSAVWAALIAKNPALASPAAEKFVRGFVAEMQKPEAVGPTFGGNFIALMAGREPACFDFRLCGAKVTPAFRLANPVGLTDILQYTFEATCHGFLPDQSRQIAVFEAINRVLRTFPKAEMEQLLQSHTFGDRVYLRGRFADMLSTAKAKGDDKARLVGPSLGLREYLIGVLPTWTRRKTLRLTLRGWGRVRPVDDEVLTAARTACNAR
jgi:hypothetical protein